MKSNAPELRVDGHITVRSTITIPVTEVSGFDALDRDGLYFEVITVITDTSPNLQTLAVTVVATRLLLEGQPADWDGQIRFVGDVTRIGLRLCSRIQRCIVTEETERIRERQSIIFKTRGLPHRHRILIQPPNK